MNWLPQPAPGRGAAARRWLILALVVAVPWVPGAVALAMLLTGNA
jgi:hypothetical protein